MFAHWRARRASKSLIEHIRGEIVAAARRPALYDTLAVPDRIEGRFEMVVLHAGLVLRRLVAIGGLGGEMAQDLVNSLFKYFDDGMREMAIGDIGVAKRLKAMAGAFYGRNSVYAAALDSGSRETLAAALSRNIYGDDPIGLAHSPALAAYVAALDQVLAKAPIESFASGRFRMPQIPIERERTSP